MNASYKWLQDFVDIDMSPRDLRDLLTARCATVDDVVILREDLAGIIVGRVVEAAHHPNSDHLWLTKVDAGDGVIHDVVCGAPNVSVGTLYPFAPVGTVLPGGLKLEKRKIRGTVSEGMLCSARELGLGTDHEGILAIETPAEPGQRLLDVMPVGDTRIIVDVLPNRPDLLSHEGLAREIAAASGRELHRPIHPPARLTRGVDSASAPPAIDVTVEDFDGSPRYMSAIITGVQIGPSPEWLSSRIEAVGGRSVNNVVDVTNYMLHGFGQPMHAFDLAHLGGGKLVVRRAVDGERLTTLDGVDRVLDSNMTVIADATSPQAIAGVIGGKGSEVTAGTTDLLLEAAAFNPARVRATRRKLNVSTDASYRFERGVDVAAIPSLLAYAAELIVRVAGGRVVGSPTDSSVETPAVAPLTLRPARVATVLGERIDIAEIVANLTGIGFTVAQTGDSLSVTPASFRQDVTGEAELIEEVARLHGYDNFPSELRAYRPAVRRDAPLHGASSRVRAALVAVGVLEARPMPFVRTGIDAHRLRNPIADDEAYLRTSLLDTLSRRVEYNMAHMERNVRLFEVGTVFTSDEHSGGTAIGERIHAAAVIVGDRAPAHFTAGDPGRFDEWDAKGIAELMANAAYPGSNIHCNPSIGDALWIVMVDGIAAGSVMRLSLDAPVWAAPAFGIEIDLEAVPGGEITVRQYAQIPVMPAMDVDLALLVPESVSAASVEETIRQSAGDMLESLTVFDEFRGKGIGDGVRSIAWRLTFRHPDRTLRDKEVQGRTGKILSVLESKLGIRQRTS